MITPIFFLVFLFGWFVLGLILGSFINVLVSRFPLFISGGGISVFSGRSHCDNCKKKLVWYELVPLVSFLVQKKKCRSCGGLIPHRYAYIELAVGCVFLLLGGTIMSGSGINGVTSFNVITSPLFFLHAMALIVGVFALTAIFFIDREHYYIPDFLIIIFFISGAIEAVIRISFFWQESFFNLGLSILGVFLFFFAIWFFSQGRAMGFGDVKFAPFFPIFFGALPGVFAIFFAFWIGAIVSVFLLASRKKGMRDRVPFGPFLVAGGFTVLFIPRASEIIFSFFNWFVYF
ncbi:MAG: prepilin peptidase [Patescibacteria group bacterium]